MGKYGANKSQIWYSYGSEYVVDNLFSGTWRHVVW